MNLFDSSGRPTRWRLRLAEYEFVVTYVKIIKNYFADALSRTTSTGGTTVSIDENIPCCSVLELEDDTLHTEEIIDDTDVHIISGCYALEPPASTAPLTYGDSYREQLSDPLCKGWLLFMQRGRGQPFLMNTERLICRSAHFEGIEQIVVQTTLCKRVLYSAHYPVTSGHPWVGVYFTRFDCDITGQSRRSTLTPQYEFDPIAPRP